MKKPFYMLMALLCAFLFVAGGAWAEEPEHEMHRGEKIARWMEEKGLSRTMAITAISTLPIVELRGAVPAGHILYETRTLKRAEKVKKALWIYGVAVAGNMLPIPFILLLLGPVSKFLMRFPVGKRFFDWLFARTRKKSASIEKYEALGLTLFVAIPLPVTGGWTGAMAAFLMGISFGKSMLYILMGVMIAGVIMTILALLGWIGALIAGAVLLALVASAVLKSFKTNGERK
ncbi:MAG: small multi-drug export protein [Verrucomicrobia bacterium]|nr:small multi-drug export protein [Verrucomicrobiota bacterium]